MRQTRTQIVVLALIVLTLIPSAAFAADSTSVNPPGWLGALFFFIALFAPIGTFFWLKNSGRG